MRKTGSHFFAQCSSLAGGRNVRWRALEGDGLEHLTLQADADGFRADSVLIGERGGQRYGATYRIDCDPDFTVRSFEITTTDGRDLVMTRRDGAWHDRARGHLPAFDACIDIDLSATPFTNTLPIRRCAWQPDQQRRIAMLFVPFDSLEPFVTEQLYTCLAPRLFRFETADGSFTAELPVDEDGLVMDYPSLFQRL
ncbi:putative glycolipid-binding domain-containing protein [Bosea vestrisii]|uniref:putative glycolipid-binding domain-containing protein n=1 Tax=Bosea vestrisii TaxID=151416 RepID=UPI0024DF7F1B|nr:putative glycolipid-binding domain-containing protein [Bosea vestrisii]WID98054.1 putative glycolipid-binding domain-containing protein [Bosea vestrisii]